MRVLLVSDDLDSADYLAYALRRAGFAVIVIEYVASVVERCKAEEPDLVLVDHGSDEPASVELCQRIRGASSVPIVLMGFHSADDEVVRALQVGVDDYILKPISPRYLIARIQAVARRARREGWAPVSGGNLTIGNVVIQFDSRQVARGDQEISLTPTEARILRSLVQSQGQVVPTSNLVWQTWGCGDPKLSGIRLRTHISRLRKKLQLGPDEPGYIRAVSGFGYRMLS